MSAPLAVHLMTATLTPGDAIGNYLLTSARLWRRWGARVAVYADAVAPAYAALAQPSAFYRPTGRALLWYHYSIYSPNLELASRSGDYTVMDFHGITPPHLLEGEPYLQQLCRQGLERLPALAASFDAAIVHSEYSRQALLAAGFAPERIHKLPLVVDTGRLRPAGASPLEGMLARLEYLLFLGRLVPQKDILALLDIFAALRAARPQTALILVGSRQLAGSYQRQIDRAVALKGLAGRVLFTGQVNNQALLAALLGHARFTLVTSEWESFCLPVVESMYFGVPPVVHQAPPLPEVAGEGGVIIDKRQPEAAAARLAALLDDPAAYQKLAAAARLRASAFTDRALEKALLAWLCRQFGRPQEAARP